MMRKNSQSYSDSVGVQETTFNIGQETTFNIGQDYAEIPARTSQEPQ